MTSANFDALELEKIPTNPYCSHGPTILFANGKKKFFACSACRDHKLCNFYLNYEHFTKKKFKEWQHRYLDHLNKLKVYQFNLKKVKTLKTHERMYCHTCNQFFFEEFGHEKHQILKDIDDRMLNRPISTILEPVVKNSTNAQFLFDDSTTKILISLIRANSYDSVLCIGTPSIFEQLQEYPEIKRFLLDIDQRFNEFYESDLFLRYNMFNHHFFTDKQAYITFLKNSKNVLLIIDPPYGGMVKLIANSIFRIKDDIMPDSCISTILIYPYFTEIWIKKWLSNFHMIDYKVLYENHKKFGKSSTAKKGSTARIFTDIEAKRIKLPLNEGYYYCSICAKYTYKENKHCEKCKLCTSKDGGEYKHCDFCERCVKMSYEHCERCGRCHLPELKSCSRRKRTYDRSETSYNYSDESHQSDSENNLKKLKR